MEIPVRRLLILLVTLVIVGCGSGAVAKSAMTIRVVRPIISDGILPTGPVTSGQVSSELGVIACRGEYEPASFVITAATGIDSLQVQANDLEGSGGVIPARQIDIKVVKCWYQSSSKHQAADKEYDKRALVPALLLNNDSLIKVNYEKKENYLKVPLSAEGEYIWISNPDEKEGDHPPIPSEEFPIKDSPVLLPVSIPANTNKQFWVTVHVPQDAKPGEYSGRITLSTPATQLSLRLKLCVLPFELSKPYYTSSMFYRNPEGPQVLLRHRKEMENLIAHGVEYPTDNPPAPEWHHKFLQTRKDLGMAGKPVFTIGGNNSPSQVKERINLYRSYGYTDVYFMGDDEASGDKLVNQLPKWKATHEAGGKVWAAGAQEAGSEETYGQPDSYFQAVGHVLDVFDNGRRPTREQAALWHSQGHKIWSYSNPHVGQDDPQIYRRNYGLLLWKNHYDGIGIYVYRHSNGNSYNDFDQSARELSFAYPTIDGVIDTVVWEGYREGIDDVRYLTTLTKAIKIAKRSTDDKVNKIAVDAEGYLETLEVEQRNLDTIRREMIDYLLKLQGSYIENTQVLQN